MAENFKMTGSEKANAFLGAGTDFEGKLSFKGIVRLDGKFSGEIHAEGTLIVGENAELKANVFVDKMELKGRMTGNATAKTSVALLKTGKLYGDITAPVMSVEEGAIFNGKSNMDEKTINRTAPPFQASLEEHKEIKE